ncbi:MAG TPA: polysaccharide biosynthesis C-terminal domain-containing protein, partial [Solirubrobacteraceae bacterium]|nr:polysaccharide biosynthesis C-terminal domain-containing protein [Solirubrobacteraceae bacterium]
RGEFDAQSTDQVAEALFWFSFSLPFSGFNLLLTRTFFSLQRPWTPTALAGVTLAINLAVSAVLYEPLGIAGVVLGTVVSTAAMTAGQAFYLRRRIGGLQLGTTARTTAKITVAAAALGATAYGTWYLLDDVLGDSLAAQIVAVGTALALGTAVYAAIVLAWRIPEAQQIRDLFTQRLRRS